MPNSTPQTTRSTQEPGKAEGAPRKQAYIVFGVVGLALLMSALDMTIVTVSLPAIIQDFHTSLALVGWTLTGYQLSLSVIMPIVGKLSDDWGRKPVFLGAVLLFAGSSAAAGLAPNIYFLIVFRILQGIGGGAFLPSATGIVSDAFGSRRATAIGLFGSIFPIGGILGPNIGGFIVDHFSWRWVFFVNIPIGALLLLLGSAVLPGSPPRHSGRRIDFIGTVLFAGAVLAMLYATSTWANNHGAMEPIVPVLFAVGAVLLFLFIRQETRVAEPMIDIKLLRWRPFLAANVYNFIFGAVVLGFFSFIPYYATVAYGMTAGQSGLILTPRAVAMIMMSAMTSFFIIRFRYRLPMIIGLVLMAVSMALLSRGYHDATILGVGLHNLVLLALLVMISGIGMGIANPAANNAALDLIPEKIAVVAGLRGMFRAIGGVVGTAGVVLALSFFPDKAIGMQDVFLGLVFLLLLLIPIVFLIPDLARDRRNRRT